MLEVKQFAFGPFGVNTFIIYDNSSREAIVVDPGMNSDAENRRFDDFIKEKELKITQIVNTHLHIDHCLGDNYVRNSYGVKVAANAGDEFFGDNIQGQSRMFGINALDDSPVSIDVNLQDGDYIELGDNRLKVLHVPGHSPGGIALYCPESNIIIAGDALFRNSIGRTDLPGGDYPTLIDAIKDKLLSLPDDTLVLSGHDMSTDIGREKRSNPFLQ